MRTRLITFLAAVPLAAGGPALAQTAADPGNVRAADVVLSPLGDVNIKRRDIPVVLRSALADPYGLEGIVTCAGFVTAIGDLDVALGDDIDVAQDPTDEEKMGNSAGAVAKSVIGSFIPFRGVLRELSGANAMERLWQRALYAGSVRRAFLKGVGEQRGCDYPARSATPAMAAALAAQRRQAALARNAKNRHQEKSAGAPVELSYESVPGLSPAVPR